MMTYKRQFGILCSTQLGYELTLSKNVLFKNTTKGSSHFQIHVIFTIFINCSSKQISLSLRAYLVVFLRSVPRLKNTFKCFFGEKIAFGKIMKYVFET